VLRSLGLATAPGHLAAAQFFGLGVRQIKLTRATPSVSESDPDGRTFPIRDFFTRHVRNTNGFLRHEQTPLQNVAVLLELFA
jgi:hypothetical protein